LFGLPFIDIAVILLYFIGMIIIGIWSMKGIKNQEDYFMGGRRFGKVVQIFASFGQSVTADNSVGCTTTTFTNGASGIWSALIYLPATPFYWIVSPWMRRLRLLTTGDFYRERYGSTGLAGTYAVLGSILMMAYLSVGFSAMSKTIMAITPKAEHELTVVESRERGLAQELNTLQNADYSTLTITEKDRLQELQIIKPQHIYSHIQHAPLVWITAIIILAYAMTGGLTAAFISDTIQGMFIILLSILLLPFAMARINSIHGGSGLFDAMHSIHRQLPESFFDIFGSPTSIDFTWYYIVAITLMAAINVVVQPNTIIATGSAKDEYTARIGFTTGTFMKRFFTVLWGVFALAAIVLYHDSITDPDMVWGYATLDLLGPLKIGLVGLMIACLMAAMMSTADCLMITVSSLLTENIYKPFVPKKSDAHYITAGRFFGVLVVLGAAYISIQFSSVFVLLKFIWEFNIILAASFWLGIRWRRANRRAAHASIYSTLVIFFILPLMIPVVFPGLRSNEALLKMTDPKPITYTYQAREMDVQARGKAIEQLKVKTRTGEIDSDKLQALHIGDIFTQTYSPPAKSIFWTRGIEKDGHGSLVGKGDLNIILYLIGRMGFDLAGNPHALNQTIRILIRMIVPFLILIIVALLTKQDDEAMLDRFFAKMKTKVQIDKEADRKEIELSYAEPSRFDHLKIWPDSDWEFLKWDREDSIGFGLSVLGVFGIFGILFIFLSIGE